MLRTGFLVILPLSVLLAAGCSPQQNNSGNPGPPPPGTMPSSAGGAGGPGGPKGMPGGGMQGRGRNTPVAANATGAEIYEAKCGCHGPGGKGGRAPVLTGVSSSSDSELYKIVHDGRKKMPAFGSQLSEEQIKKVVTYIKQLPSG